MKRLKKFFKEKNKKIDIYIICILIFIILLILFVIFPEITFKKFENFSNKIQILSASLKYEKNKIDRKISGKYIENNTIVLNDIKKQNNEKIRETLNKTKEKQNTKKEIIKYIFNKNDSNKHFLKETIILNYPDDKNIEESINNNSYILKDNFIYNCALYVNEYKIIYNEENKQILEIDYLYKNINYPEKITHTNESFYLNINDLIINSEDIFSIEIKESSQTDFLKLFFDINDIILYDNEFNLDNIKLIFEDNYNFKEILLREKE